MERDSVKPNFFILGAPKCGTTAMSEYLRTHPDVCFSEPKEPNFFCKDFPNHVRHKNVNDYFKNCFGRCASFAQRVGEGTVLYFSSAVAVNNILDFNPDSKLVVMVRNPVDMAYSWHGEMLKLLHESEDDFMNAWRLRKQRSKGISIPRQCKDKKLLQYGKICKTGEQLQRLYEKVPPEQVHVIVFDDFVEDTRQEYVRLLDFLGLEDDGRTEFPRVNPNQEVNRTWKLTLKKIGNFVTGPVEKASEKTKNLLGIDDWGILNRLQRFGEKETERKPLDTAFREELKDYFRDDVELLSKLLDRDLTHWVDPEPVESAGEAV